MCDACGEMGKTTECRRINVHSMNDVDSTGRLEYAFDLCGRCYRKYFTEGIVDDYKKRNRE